MISELVSVIIPAYNHEKYIDQTLSSIINQTYSDIELIIINDGSSDGTDKKINELKSSLEYRFSRFIYTSKRNEGICKTLNQGLKLANGEYIIPFASDDVMLPSRIEKQINYLKLKKDYDAVYTDMCAVETNGVINLSAGYDTTCKTSEYMSFAEGYILEFMLDNVFLLPTPTLCMRRDCYNKVGYYDEDLFGEDIDMLIRMAKIIKMGYIKEVLTLHRLHDNNTGKRRDITVDTILKLKQKYKNSTLFTPEEKSKLLNTFYRYTGI